MKLELNGITVTKTSAKDISTLKKAGYKEVKDAKPKKDAKAAAPKAGE